MFGGNKETLPTGIPFLLDVLMEAIKNPRGAFGAGQDMFSEIGMDVDHAIRNPAPTTGKYAFAPFYPEETRALMERQRGEKAKRKEDKSEFFSKHENVSDMLGVSPKSMFYDKVGDAFQRDVMPFIDEFSEEYPNAAESIGGFLGDERLEPIVAALTLGGSRAIPDIKNIPNRVMNQADSRAKATNYEEGIIKLFEKSDLKKHGMFEDESLEQALRQNPQSREILLSMTPEEFKELAMPMDFLSNDVKSQWLRESLVDRGERLRDIPQLWFENRLDEPARITGHEGRHRAHILEQLGMENMPVRFISTEHGDAPAIRWGQQDSINYDTLHPDDYPSELKSEAGGLTVPFPIERPLGTQTVGQRKVRPHEEEAQRKTFQEAAKDRDWDEASKLIDEMNEERVAASIFDDDDWMFSEDDKPTSGFGTVLDDLLGGYESGINVPNKQKGFIIPIDQAIKDSSYQGKVSNNAEMIALAVSLKQRRDIARDMESAGATDREISESTGLHFVSRGDKGRQLYYEPEGKWDINVKDIPMTKMQKLNIENYEYGILNNDLQGQILGKAAQLSPAEKALLKKELRDNTDLITWNEPTEYITRDRDRFPIMNQIIDDMGDDSFWSDITDKTGFVAEDYIAKTFNNPWVADPKDLSRSLDPDRMVRQREHINNETETYRSNLRAANANPDRFGRTDDAAYHPIVSELYPEVFESRIETQKEKMIGSGSFSPTIDYVAVGSKPNVHGNNWYGNYMNKQKSADKMNEVIAHEVTHKGQSIFDMPAGGNQNEFSQSLNQGKIDKDDVTYISSRLIQGDSPKDIADDFRGTHQSDSERNAEVLLDFFEQRGITDPREAAVEFRKITSKPFDLYRQLWGEANANASMERMFWTDAQRRAYPYQQHMEDVGGVDDASELLIKLRSDPHNIF